MELNRTAEQWQKCDPKAMAKMSEPAIMYALADDRSDVLRMHAEVERLKQVRCEGCGYLVSEREHLGCKSEKTLKDLERLTTERDNAEKREYEVLGRANALEAELKATQARLVASDELLRKRVIAQRVELRRLNKIIAPRWAAFSAGLYAAKVTELRGKMIKAFGHQAVYKAENGGDL